MVRMFLNDRLLEDDFRTLKEELQPRRWLPYVVKFASATLGWSSNPRLSIELDHPQVYRECIVDTEQHLIPEFPRRITAECRHIAQVCHSCLEKTINSKLDSNTWDNIKCPECPARFSYYDVRNILTSEDFQKCVNC
jgi:hypothetical protein